MAVDVQPEIVIQRPIDEVSAFAGDPSKACDWYVNIKSVRWETSPPLVLGSRVSYVASFLGKELAYTYEVVELEPGRRLVMRTDEGPMPMETTYEWFELPGDVLSTRMTLRNRGEAKGLQAFTAPLLSWSMRRANLLDLDCLKRRLEAAPSKN